MCVDDEKIISFFDSRNQYIYYYDANSGWRQKYYTHGTNYIVTVPAENDGALEGYHFWADNYDGYFSGNNSYYKVKHNGVVLSEYDARDIWTDGSAIYYSNGENQWIWEGGFYRNFIDYTWDGDKKPEYGRDIWTDGHRIYYSHEEDQWYLDGNEWKDIDWTNGEPWAEFAYYGRDIWTDGERIYYSTVTNWSATLMLVYDHEYNDWEPDKTATCAVAGSRRRTCTTCGHVDTEEIPATSEHTWNNGDTTTPATCTGEGVMTYTCNVCGTTRTEAINASGHEFGDWEVIKAATCVEPGHKTRHCVKTLSDGITPCKVYEEEEIPATGVHAYGGWTITKEPTTEETGEQEHKCTICGHTETNEIAKLTLKNKFKVVPVAAGTAAGLALVGGVALTIAARKKKRYHLA